ncbi:MAG TPA: hypothetical protein VK453_03390 [Micromonosporaceae bacterium]|nr:hypothetical protein [Micromonosporaceae bacterium]
MRAEYGSAVPANASSPTTPPPARYTVGAAAMRAAAASSAVTAAAPRTLALARVPRGVPGTPGRPLVGASAACPAADTAPDRSAPVGSAARALCSGPPGAGAGAIAGDCGDDPALEADPVTGLGCSA